MNEPNIYRIPVVNFPRLEEEIAKLNKRAKKLGCEPITLSVKNTVVEKRKSPHTNVEYDLVIQECTVSGQAPKINGWTLVAVLEPVVDTGELLVKEVPGQVCPESYRHTNFNCDHCGTIRKRNAIFVLRYEDGSHKQVGRNCIADFLGHKNPDSILGLAEMLFNTDQLLAGASDEFWGLSSGVIAAPIHYFVTLVNSIIRSVGWISRTQAQEDDGPSTANLAYDICTAKTHEQAQKLIKYYKLEITEEDPEVAAKAIQWASEISSEEAGSTYMHDLGVCCRSKIVTYKTAGYVASVVNAYKRHISSLEIAKAKNIESNHIGEVGSRLTFDDLTILKLHSVSSGLYPKTLVRFSDPQGNIMIWWASGSPQWLQVGKHVKVKGTVCKHSLYNDIPQTELKRVTLVDTNKENVENRTATNRV